jgi:hypothetical protein
VRAAFLAVGDAHFELLEPTEPDSTLARFLETRKCLHLYHYFQHPDFGLMHVRVQSWFPFTVDVCLNGREWLARQMEAGGLKYLQRDNCFTWVEDPLKAQALLDQQLDTNWTERLNALLEQAHPLHREIGRPFHQPYYWSASQTEYARRYVKLLCMSV